MNDTKVIFCDCVTIITNDSELTFSQNIDCIHLGERLQLYMNTEKKCILDIPFSTVISLSFH